MDFVDVTIEQLEAAGPSWLDDVNFGVIGLSPTGLVDVYNTFEARMAGLAVSSVLGRHFFDSVGICMNNYMVAQRFEDEVALDETINYVLTLRMRPTPVRLRLLKQPGIARSYLLVQQL